ncbi:MAG: hypothetical protein GX811_03510, partial [Lentisphaerae bacterium]|nr:hypothetical protein [Lentisphaerota bacterium]
GQWNGNAPGSLNVTNEATDLFREFSVTNNPPVNEAHTRIERNPEVNATLYRTDFGDDPVNHNWLNWLRPWEPKTRSGRVTYDGSVSRPYKYKYHCDEENCSGHTRHARASAEFDSGNNMRNIKALIYNGMETITPKIFDNKIDNNTTKKLQKNLYWTSKQEKFDVIRWMHHVDQNNVPYADIAVDGQYQRNFTQQCSAVNTWKVASSMAKDYKNSRDAARNRDYRKDEYDKAVFASDIDFEDVDYPIKSGYYFNPTGKYTFTVETVTYKTTRDDTKDHQELVNAVINVFRYESDLMYINDDGDPVNLKNELLPQSGSSYGRRSAVLTVEDATRGNGLVLFKVDSSYRKESVEEIQHSEETDGDTHQYWREILEGYDESGTGSSNYNYKYREYIKDGKNMYKITEKTTVTIEINPGNRKIYTHVHMPDGKYTVKAWIEDIDLTKINHEYKKLGVLKGITTLDEIEVSVKGSMYEDTN